MTKVGRNHPCPCGSGKKYKLCCLTAHEAARLASNQQQQSSLEAIAAVNPAPWASDDEVERLDQISNGALDLIHAGRLKEAERMCQQLLTEFPEVFDGHMRLGQLHRVRGDPKKAAEHLRIAASMARSTGADPDLANGLDAEADEIDPPA